MTRITFWSPNYAPELTGIPPLVTDAAEWLAGRGHSVRVVTAFPNYPSRRIDPAYRGALWRREWLNGVRIERSSLRVRPTESFVDKVAYEISFATLSLPLAVRAVMRSDVLVCVVPSLVAAAYSRLLATILRRLRVVLWVQDLVLEGAAALRPSTGARLGVRLGRRVERFAVGGADRFVVCSPGFRDHLLRLGVRGDAVETLYNWVDTKRIVPLPRARTAGGTRFLYAGNIGYSQGLETVVEAARLVAPACSVRIVGDGNAAAAVRAAAAHVDSVSVEPPVPREVYPQLLADTDVQLVIQRRVSAGANLPSKIASYLASGRPILAAIDSSTAAAELLHASGAALLVEPENARAIAEGMTKLHEDDALRSELGARGRAYAVAELDLRPSLERFEDMLASRPAAPASGALRRRRRTRRSRRADP